MGPVEFGVISCVHFIGIVIILIVVLVFSSRRSRRRRRPFRCCDSYVETVRVVHWAPAFLLLR